MSAQPDVGTVAARPQETRATQSAAKTRNPEVLTSIGKKALLEIYDNDQAQKVLYQRALEQSEKEIGNLREEVASLRDEKSHQQHNSLTRNTTDLVQQTPLSVAQTAPPPGLSEKEVTAMIADMQHQLREEAHEWRREWRSVLLKKLGDTDQLAQKTAADLHEWKESAIRRTPAFIEEVKRQVHEETSQFVTPTFQAVKKDIERLWACEKDNKQTTPAMLEDVKRQVQEGTRQSVTPSLQAMQKDIDRLSAFETETRRFVVPSYEALKKDIDRLRVCEKDNKQATLAMLEDVKRDIREETRQTVAQEFQKASNAVQEVSGRLDKESSWLFGGIEEQGQVMGDLESRIQALEGRFRKAVELTRQRGADLENRLQAIESKSRLAPSTTEVAAVQETSSLLNKRLDCLVEVSEGERERQADLENRLQAIESKSRLAPSTTEVAAEDTCQSCSNATGRDGKESVGEPDLESEMKKLRYENAQLRKELAEVALQRLQAENEQLREALAGVEEAVTGTDDTACGMTSTLLQYKAIEGNLSDRS